MILCCGEALIDMIAGHTADGAPAFTPHTGGAVFNTAIALGRLGAPVGLLSGVSSDMFGQQLVADLRASKVDPTALIYSDRPTTLAFVALRDGQAEYAFFDENTAGRLLTSQDMLDILSVYQAGYFGGISLACEPCGPAYATLAARLAPDHVIMLDPNIRAPFIAHEDSYRARLSQMMRQSDIIKVSHEDLAWLMPRESTDIEAADADTLRQFRQQHAPQAVSVIMTKGAEGTVALLHDDRVIRVAGQPADVVDTVGAGDSFNAGVLAKLHALGVLHKATLSHVTADDWQAALGYGVQVASITVARAGANPPWKQELV